MNNYKFLIKYRYYNIRKENLRSGVLNQTYVAQAQNVADALMLVLDGYLDDVVYSKMYLKCIVEVSQVDS